MSEKITAEDLKNVFICDELDSFVKRVQEIVDEYKNYVKSMNSEIYKHMLDFSEIEEAVKMTSKKVQEYIEINDNYVREYLNELTDDEVNSLYERMRRREND